MQGRSYRYVLMRSDEFHTSLATSWSTIQPLSLSSFRQVNSQQKKNRFSTRLLTLLPSLSGLNFQREDLNRLYFMAADSVSLPRKAIRESSNSWRFCPLPVVGESDLNPEPRIHDRRSGGVLPSRLHLLLQPLLLLLLRQQQRVIKERSNVNNWVLNLLFAVKWRYRKLLKDEGWIVDQNVAMEVWNSSARISTSR